MGGPEVHNILRAVGDDADKSLVHMYGDRSVDPVRGQCRRLETVQDVTQAEECFSSSQPRAFQPVGPRAGLVGLFLGVEHEHFEVIFESLFDRVPDWSPGFFCTW